MKLVCDYMDGIEEFHNEISYVMVKSLDKKDLIEKLIEENFTPILSVMKMVHPLEMDSIVSSLLGYQDTSCLFYVTDLGLAYRLKQAGLEKRIIYDPVTMITNSLDAKAYAELGFYAVGLSNEITLADANQIACMVPAFYQLFGYRLMFHSARRLVHLYGEQMSIPLEDGTYQLREITRSDRYPLKEQADGTYLYRSYPISLLTAIPELDMKLGYLSSEFIEPSIYQKVVRIFIDYLQNPTKELVQQMNELVSTQDGFRYEDSVYLKEDF